MGLVGPGGIGKTRLALQTAQIIIDSKAVEDFFGAVDSASDSNGARPIDPRTVDDEDSFLGVDKLNGGFGNGDDLLVN